MRLPAVAGMFYPADPDQLKEQIQNCFLNATLGPGSIPQVNLKGSRRIKAIIVPHAGYIYSGYTAARAYYQLAEDGIPDTAVLIGPNHRGYGSPFAVYAKGTWLTPLGSIEIEEEISQELIKNNSVLKEDENAHQLEHSLEVQLPFLQYLYGNQLKIVPITAATLDPYDADNLGEALTPIIKNRNTVVIISTDFNHYQSERITLVKDNAAIISILSLDPEKFLTTVLQQGITLCGVVPVAGILAAARSLENIDIRLLGHSTSGDITGVTDQVVGYASLEIVERYDHEQLDSG